MHRALASLAIVAVALLASCGGGSADGPPAVSGIRGTVTLGPQCAVVQAGSPCPDAPWNGSIRVTGEDGTRLEAPTFDGGRFRIAVPPGTYVIAPVVAGSGPPTAIPRTVEVPAEGYVEVALTVDTGIR
jgi:hypothetical protein